ncbi:MAG: hypothetical protein WCO13_11155 [Bacteroidota bacterium]
MVHKVKKIIKPIKPNPIHAKNTDGLSSSENTDRLNLAIQNKVNTFILAFLTILFGLTISVIIFALNKGFDITDEGTFLLLFKNVDIYRGGVYNYHIIISKLTNWLNPGILEYRWMTLILTIFSSFILSGGLYIWLNTNYKKYNFHKTFLFIFGFISIGSLIICFCSSITIYMNVLTNSFLIIATGLILYLFSFDAANLIKLKTNIIIIGILGLICGFSFFNKFSTAILQLSAYFLLFILYLKDQKLKHIIIVVLTLGLGCVFGVLIYFSFFQSSGEWLFNFKKEYIMLSDHSPTLLIDKYITDFKLLAKVILKYFSWLILFPIFILWNNYHPFNNKYLINLILLISVGIFIREIYYFNFYRSTFLNSDYQNAMHLTNDWINAYFYIIVILLQLFLLLAIGITKKNALIHLLKINFDKTLIIFLLLITPFLGAIGTANHLFLNVLIHSATWFGVIIILLFYLSEHLKSRIILSLFIIIPSLVTASQIIDGNTFTPYYSFFFNLNKSNVLQQTEDIKGIPRLKGIHVDKKTKTFFLELQQLFKNNNYRKGYPIFGFNMSGVVYLLEGISPGWPYYFNDKERDCKAFEFFELKNNPPIILLADGFPINLELFNTMKMKGINFNDYLLKGEVYFPNKNSMLKVYFPKNY